MTSPLLASCRTGLEQLKASLIIQRDDISYTREDHDKALGFRVLASAHIEDYVEKRCTEVAARGVERFLNGKPTRTGRALLVWYSVHNRARLAIPLRESECVPRKDRLDSAHAAYLASVKATHGMSGQDARALVIPLGVEESDLDERLFDQMDSLAQIRQKAAHVIVKRAKTMTEPIKEWTDVEDVLVGLAGLDDALQRALDGF